jgi:transposase InsO family protein
MKFAFIHAEKARFPVGVLCRLLGVSRQGYYAHAKRPVSDRARAELQLHERLRALHRESRGTYGSPRMRAALQAEGVRVSKRRVERALRGLGLGARPRRRTRATTKPNPAHPVAPNTLARSFTASRPNERWVTDITYVWTQEGWAYVAVILDLFSRAVVGWSLDASLETRLVRTALENAVERRRPAAGSLLHHSDRGCQYTSQEYRSALANLGVEVSMSRRGNCWDNAVAESFFATLKSELVAPKAGWNTRADLRAAVFEYIEVFYNRRRLHSSNNYRTPAQAEADYDLASAA